MNIFDIVTALEGNDALHEARLMVLLEAFAGSDGTGAVEGLTKLAKLDFLLRYPVCLERALAAKGVKPELAAVEAHERHSVESKMIRFKYGPWDFRYRRFINLLAGKRLVHVGNEAGVITISLTATGHAEAQRLAIAPEFSDLASRSQLLHKHFDIQATSLMKFVYQHFPELSTMRYGETIVT